MGLTKTPRLAGYTVNTLVLGKSEKLVSEVIGTAFFFFFSPSFLAMVRNDGEIDHTRSLIGESSEK